MLADFHFLRPAWFIAVLPLLWLGLRMWRHHSTATSAWHDVIDPALQGQLLASASTPRSRWPLLVVLLLWLTAIVALAGPVWDRQKTPLYRTVTQRVLVVDLSRSMNATDIKPSRIARTRQKLSDILDESAEAQTALVVFSAVPYVVSPLTDDIETVRSMLPALATELVPAQGSRPALALLEALQLLDSAGSTDGEVLLITDGRIDERTTQAASQIVEAGYSLSVLGVGTEQGAPIPADDGGYLKDRDGNIVVPSLDQAALRELASSAGGVYSRISADNRDLDRLIGQLRRPGGALQDSDEQSLGDTWIERGPWLVAILLPLVSLGFRRGWLS